MPRTIINAQGREEPFDPLKVVSSILSALRKAEYRDESEADHIAPMVEYALSRYFGEKPPTVDDVAHCIEQALRSLPGFVGVADAYVDARQRRLELAAIEDGVAPTADGPRVASRSDLSLKGWERSRLEAALVREHAMPMAQAQEIAGVVEMQVRSLDLEEVSTSLLRELVDAQLAKHGVLAGDFGIGQLSLPAWDIEEAIFPQEDASLDSSLDTPRDLERFVAQAVMRQFTWRRIHHAGVREGSLDAKIAFAASGQPQRFQRISLDARDLLSASAGFSDLPFFAEPVSSLNEAIERLAQITAVAVEHAAEEVELRSLDSALASLVRSRGEEGECCRALRIRLSGLAKKGVGIAVSFDALAGRMDRAGSIELLNAWLRDGFDDIEASRTGLETRLAVGEASADDPVAMAALKLAAEAAVSGRPVLFSFERPRRSTRRRGLFGDTSSASSAQEVISASGALNLGRPLLADPKASEGAILEALGESLALLVEGLSERDAFARRFHLRRRDARPSESETIGRRWAESPSVVEIHLVGLHEYANAVSQGASASSEGYRSAMDRLLGFLTLRVNELGEDLGIETRFAGGRGEASFATLSNTSRRLWPEGYERLVGAMSRDFSQGAAIPAWVDLKAEARIALEGRLHGVMKSSAVLLEHEVEHLKSEELVRLLIAATLSADAKVRALRYQVSLRQCSRCAIMARPDVRVCPACGSRDWRVPHGQKMLFDEGEEFFGRETTPED